MNKSADFKKNVEALIKGFHEQVISHPAAQDDKSQRGSSKDIKSWVVDCIPNSSECRKSIKRTKLLDFILWDDFDAESRE